jgi:thymidylate synthase (FAD)
MANLGQMYYDEAREYGVAPELARLFLPAYSLYVRWRWTVSLAGVMNFLDQREEHDAQYEIQKYAQSVRDLTVSAFPKTMEARNNVR